VVGRHVGLSFYTRGQRQGLGIGGVKAGGGSHTPWYAARKDLARNVLVAVQDLDHPWLMSDALVAADCSWVAGTPPAAGTLSAKTRYRQPDMRCCFTPTGDGFELGFEQAQWAVTPGQSAVLYDGEVCLGGGVITR
jgi:tRNA-specific 2-thiouridylase